MRLDSHRVRELLRGCDFTSLFVEELGWNHCDLSPIAVPVDGQEYVLTAISEMGGLVALQCGSSSDTSIPDYHVRRKIDRLVSKLHYEHIIIYCDSQQQVWQWVKKEPGHPSASREHHFYYDQSGLPLIQKLDGLVFALDELDENGNVSIKAISDRVKSALDVDKVTKKFYDRFKEELKAFKGFIQGITNEARIDWYASLMLNRLMFIYFIQKKGFLDRNPNYLRDRLAMVQEQRGRNHYYSFYRSFLRVLFHDGLNSKTRTPGLLSLIGNVPYLNGGLFEEHQIEQESPDLDIPDDAFERVFRFFDQYEWHLETRPMRNDREINPDVLGYIFEKYVNQKQMGAYYTKEDITEYISKNTIIPYLFGAVEKKCAIAFEGDNSVWRLLQENPDNYIYAAVKLGVIDRNGNVLPESDLPDFVQVGMHDPKARMFDNRYNLTEADFRDAEGNKLTLPTETWREYVNRRNRCLEVREKLKAGEVRSIDDLITLNLDIRQFAQDVIENTESPDLLRSFWEVLRKITVLDPTCGSGAFLFAALNILEPLYEGCLGRMREFLEIWGDVGKQAHPNYHKWFTETLQRVEEHPNLRYFIYKSIILNNLFGVDIMPEAVEICKLRLFLKLAAEVEPDASKQNMGLEPLPDIDFNIRAGNTLVGFATYDEVKKAVTSRLDFDDTMAAIEEKASEIDELFGLFREMQEKPDSAEVTASDKQELRNSLKPLEEELNAYLARQYVIDAKQHPQRYANWVETHQPFHWFIEFHSIMRAGGFDVVIGNPPYVVYSSERVGYSLPAGLYETADAKNTYAYVFERSCQLASARGLVGLIVQMTVLSSERLSSLQGLLLRRGRLCATSFPRRPESVFNGVEMPVAILLSLPSVDSLLTTSRVNRFYTEERESALPTMRLIDHVVRLDGYRIAKFGSPYAQSIFGKVHAQRNRLEVIAAKASKHTVYYQEACRYWSKAMVGVPYFARNGAESNPPHGRFLSVRDETAAAFTACLLNSSLFYWYYSSFSDCEHINDVLVRCFPIPNDGQDADWRGIWSVLRDNLAENASRKSITTKEGHKIEYDEIKALKSKPLIDDIDRLLAKHYGFTDEELDFIVNYDIKYRMGLGGDEEEE
jgi:hypothetical protein